MRIGRSFLPQNKYRTMHGPIPQYRLREWHRHLKRIAENATCDPGDTRTANALRLARKDLCEMERHILTKNDNDKT